MRKEQPGPPVRCKRCGDTIQSTSQHDFVSCSCETVSVDGGGYLRLVGDLEACEVWRGGEWREVSSP